MRKHLDCSAILLLSLAPIMLLTDNAWAWDLSPEPILHTLKVIFIWPILSLFKNTIFSLGFAGALTVTLTAERLFPADPNQKLFSLSFWQDLVWFFYETILHAFIIATWVYMIEAGYQKFFSFLTIESVRDWPAWTRFIIGFCMLDFLYWIQHYFNHKVSWLWEFHTVHHSQKNLNFFSDFRYHVVEYLIRHTILSIPFLIVAVQIPTIIVFAIFQRWYTRFYHGNIRTNFGPLKHILVTPQSHRIHHSYQPEHIDKNFGSILAIWDQMFGTQYRGYDEYPPTGIADEHFPQGKSMNIGKLLSTPLVQLAYPFQVIARRIKNAHSRTP